MLFFNAVDAIDRN